MGSRSSGSGALAAAFGISSGGNASLAPSSRLAAAFGSAPASAGNGENLAIPSPPRLKRVRSETTTPTRSPVPSPLRKARSVSASMSPRMDYLSVETVGRRAGDEPAGAGKKRRIDLASAFGPLPVKPSSPARPAASPLPPPAAEESNAGTDKAERGGDRERSLDHNSRNHNKKDAAVTTRHARAGSTGSTSLSAAFSGPGMPVNRRKTSPALRQTSAPSSGSSARGGDNDKDNAHSARSTSVASMRSGASARLFTSTAASAAGSKRSSRNPSPAPPAATEKPAATLMPVDSLGSLPEAADIPGATSQDSEPPRSQKSSQQDSQRQQQQNGVSPKLVKVASAHETQEAGSSQSFFDEMDYLMDGMRKDKLLTTRLRSILNFARQCSVQEFRMYLRAHSAIPRAVNALLQNVAQNDDTQTTVLVSVYALHVLTRDRLTSELGVSCLPLLTAALNSPDCPEWPAFEQGTSAIEDVRVRRVVDEIMQTIRKDSPECMADDKAPSVHLMAVQCVAELTKYSADVRQQLEPKGLLERVVHIATDATEALDTTDTSSESAPLPLRILMSCLNSLENMTFIGASPTGDLLYGDGEDGVAAMLLRILGVANSMDSSRLSALHGAHAKITSEIIIGTLRVLLNLTNDQRVRDAISARTESLQLLAECAVSLPPRLSVLFSAAQGGDSQSQEEQGSEHQLPEYDLLVHSLGLLVNLLEMSPDNRAVMATLELPSSSDPQIQVDLVDALADMFERHNTAGHALSQRLAEEPQNARLQKNQTESVVLLAYLAMVVAWLACDNPPNQRHIVSRLAAQNRANSSLEHFVQRLAQFDAFQEVTGVSYMDGAGGHVKQAVVILKSMIQSVL